MDFITWFIFSTEHRYVFGRYDTKQEANFVADKLRSKNDGIKIGTCKANDILYPVFPLAYDQSDLPDFMRVKC